MTRSRLMGVSWHPTRVLSGVLAVALAAVAGGQQTPGAADEWHAPVAESLQAQIDELQQRQEAGELSDEDKTRLRLYRGALESLQAAEQAEQRTAELVQGEAQVPVEMEAIRAELTRPPTELAPQVPPAATLGDLETALHQAEADLDAARTRLHEIEAELQTRDTLRAEIAEQIGTAQQDLETLVRQEAALPLVDESDALTEARRANLLAARWAVQKLITRLEEQRRSSDDRRELVPAQRELSLRRVNQQSKLHAAWQAHVDEARSEEIRQQRQEAARAVTLAHPLVAAIAEANVELAHRRDELRPRIEQAQQELQAITPDPDELRTQFRRLEQKIQVVGMTSTVGLLLRKARASLPDIRVHRADISQRMVTMADLEFERLELEDEFEGLVAGREETITDLLDELEPGVPDEERQAIEQEIREQLALKQDYLSGLNDDLTLCFTRLDALNEKNQRLVDVTKELTAFIDEHILWIRSAQPLRLVDVKHTAAAVAWLVNPSEWAGIGRALWTASKSHWPRVILFTLVLVALLAVRHQIGARIRSIGDRLAGPSDATFGQTTAVAIYTILRAAVWPGLVWALGAWFHMADPDGEIELAGALATSLQTVTVTLFVLLLAYEACLPRGLGEAHFGWRARNVRVARRHVGWLTVVIAILGVLVGTMSNQSDHIFESSLGRLAFIAAVLALAVFVLDMLNPKTGILRDFLARNPDGWANRLRHIWFPAALLTPLVLAVASIIGFQYTALRICGEVLHSLSLLVVIVLLYNLGLRWILHGQRKLALEQARTQREAYEERATRGEGDTGEGPPPIEAAQIDISAISAQALQMMRGAVLFAVLIGFAVIWSDTLPAIAFLERVELWQGAEVVQANAAAGVEAMYDMINLEDLLWSILLLVVTVIVAKNIPGLLEVTVLQHLPLERGSQFAISTIVRYTITIVGVVVAFNVIGVTWAKVQWLAAALTVGLGFGLNEIFGNFISGLIILFERPIRVGDTVSIGTVHGTITQIKIRSTTLVDWDRKEHIIPNKVFVMDTVVNWTLSDPILRLIFPVVIEHGSDTALAEKLLLKAAKDHPHVVDEPPPTVMFKKVGEEGLEIDLRLFIPHIDHFVRVKHEIHNAIVSGFREAGVRFFAFSHRDIEVRSMIGVEPDAFAQRQKIEQ